MTDDPETVAAALNRPGVASETVAMYELLKGDRPPEDLSYEDWVNPMKLTGGRVCLKFDFVTHRQYVRRRGDGLLECHNMAPPSWADYEYIISPGELRRMVHDCPPEPVLRSETPFADHSAEVDDGD